MKMKHAITFLLRRLGLLSFDYLVRRQDQYPSNKMIPQGELWLVVDAGVKKWVCFKCPGGCDVQISLSLNPSRRPCWSIESDFWGRPSISPSIHQHDLCNCHFWIKKGRILWCPRV